MRTLIRKLVLEYGNPEQGRDNQTRRGSQIGGGSLQAEPCDVDLDGQAVVMKWRLPI